jgi:uncharacterized protein YlzI (FlbEa/FlbD family)
MSTNTNSSGPPVVVLTHDEKDAPFLVNLNHVLFIGDDPGARNTTIKFINGDKVVVSESAADIPRLMVEQSTKLAIEAMKALQDEF